MKNTLLSFFSLFAFLGIMNSQNYKISQKNSSALWTGKAAFNSYSLSGSVQIKSGVFTIENNKITNFEIKIDMKSIDHENKDLKNHLKGKDFFEVNTYKTAKFTLTEQAQIIDGYASLIGIMTIKNISKEETLLLKVDLVNNLLLGNIQINRTAYGASFNSPSLFEKLKEDAIADEFSLEYKLVIEKTN